MNQTEENPEQAIFAVYCMIGDWLLAEFWLSQFRKCINFDFQLHNYCDTIEQVGFTIIGFQQTDSFMISSGFASSASQVRPTVRTYRRSCFMSVDFRLLCSLFF